MKSLQNSKLKISEGLVSILVPAWNAENYIAKAIDGVVSQTYHNWEMIIVDDCSPDHTSEIVDVYAKKDERIKLFKMPKNSGPAAARNKALEIACGRWIAMLDSDDIWLPQKLERQLAFHKSSNANITYTAFRRIDSSGEKLGRLISVPSMLKYNDLLGNTSIVTSTVLIDRFLSPQIYFKETYYDDFVCWLDLLRGGGIALGLQEDLTRYRIVNGSVSRNKWRSAKEVWKTYRNVEQLSYIKSMWYFCNYAINALQKYSKF